MKYIIVTFRSRNQTLLFSQILSSYNIKSKIINTPRSATVSCGLSVKIEEQDFEVVKSILARRNFQGFAGFFKVYNIGNNQIVTPI